MGALTDLPPELVVGWAIWVIGGLLLTRWFTRRSALPRPRDMPPMATPASTRRLSGTHAVAVRTLSGTHAVAARTQSATHAVAARTPSDAQAMGARVQSGTRPRSDRPPSGVQHPDAYADLRALLDPPDEPPRVG